MTIEEAIQHCEENSVKEKNNGNEACSIEYMQLRNWLYELKHIKESQSREVYKNTFIELKDDSGSIYVRQEDNKIFTENSGLVLLHKLSKTEGANLFGSVQLKTIERSRVAVLADMLDRLEE